MEHKDLTPLEKYLLDKREELDHVEEVDVEGIWEGVVRRQESGVRGGEPGTRNELGVRREEPGERGEGLGMSRQESEIRIEGRGARNEELNRSEVSGGRVQESGVRVQESGVGSEERSASNWHISIGRNWRWGIAASIVLAVSLYFLLPQEKNNVVSADIKKLLPEIAAQADNYQRLIAQKEGDLNLSKIDKNVFGDIFKELQLLEELHKEYLQDLPRYEKNDHLVNTLLRYYERKIKILERLSREIEKKKINHEKIIQEKRI